MIQAKYANTLYLFQMLSMNSLYLFHQTFQQKNFFLHVAVVQISKHVSATLLFSHVIAEGRYLKGASFLKKTKKKHKLERLSISRSRVVGL